MERKPLITEVYFITHPAWTVSSGLYDVRHTPNQICNRIDGAIKPAVDLASKRRNAFVIIVKQGPPPKMNKAKAQYAQYAGLGRRGARNRTAIEKNLAKYIAGKMGERHVVISTRNEYEFPDSDYLKNFAGEIAKQIREKGFEISQDAIVWGLGTYREKCAHAFSEEFMFQNQPSINLRNLRLPIWGTISQDEKPAEYERRRRKKGVW